MALPSQRANTERIIEWLIAQLGDQKIQANPLLRPWYAAQLAEQISIFPDLKAKFSADSRCTALLSGGGLPL